MEGKITLDKVFKNKQYLEKLSAIIGGDKEIEKLKEYLKTSEIDSSKFICNFSNDGFLGYFADYMDFDNMVFIPLFTLSKDMLEMARFKKNIIEMKKQWDNRDLVKYLVFLHRRYYSEFLNAVEKHLIGKFDNQYIWDCFEHVWIDSEYLNGYIEKKSLLQFFKLNPNIELEKEKLKELLDENGLLTIYRGEAYKSVNYSDGALSWTLSKNKAKWFSTRFGDDGDVYMTKIPLSNVLSYITSRSEDEIIFDAEDFDGIIELL